MQSSEDVPAQVTVVPEKSGRVPMRTVQIGLFGGLAVILGVGGFVLVNHLTATGAAVSGSVTSVNAGSSSFSVTTGSNGTFTVKVSGATQYKEHRLTVAFSSIVPGDQVSVYGTTSGNTATATEVEIRKGPSVTKPQHPHAHGTPTASTSSAPSNG